jgi:hypothetical protein
MSFWSRFYFFGKNGSRSYRSRFLSDKAIVEARILAEKCGVNVNFIESNVYDLPNVLEEKFDIVFTSYGVIGWLQI